MARIGAAGKEMSDPVGSAAVRGLVQGRRPVGVDSVHGRRGAKQLIDDIQPTVLGGDPQRGHPFALLRLVGEQGGDVASSRGLYEVSGAGRQQDLALLRPARKGEPERAGSRFFKPLRQTVESIFDTYKGSSTSNTTAAALPPASWSASCNASSP